MISARTLALCLGFALAVTSAAADPSGKTFAELAASGKQTYDSARKELATRGAKAKAAAFAGDVAKWKPLNDAYAQQLSELVGICEHNVVALTHDASDVETTATKQISQSFNQYAEVAGSMATVRLQMIAFGHLIERIPGSDRASVLKALAPKYFVGE